MRILFIHQNFPGQFRYLALALAARGHEVTAMTMAGKAPERWQGIRLVSYRAARGSTPGIHPWVADIESKTIRGEACFRACLNMRAEGYSPDLIVAHPGWGESLFIKKVWPAAKLGIYCEFFYRHEGADIAFDPEFPVKDADGNGCRIQMKNLNNMLHFEFADAGLSPTQWQASTFPEPFRSRISVMHDGIDTSVVTPNPAVSFSLDDGRELTCNDEVITFVNRNLEPYRGFHVFMRALPGLLKRRPNAQVLIVGGDDVSYGAHPAEGGSWKELLTGQVRPLMADEEWNRIHFLCKIPWPRFIALLQRSTVHVYLTYPFVLSWSLLEAMSAGCAIVASDTAPVREVITHDETGRLVDFFDTGSLAGAVSDLLDDPSARQRLGTRARGFVQERYDLRTICLPGQLAWVARLAGSE
jgi:glycosyltransferase involved in cell wall biosynthesis